MATKAHYQMSLSSGTYILRDGSPCVFVSGSFYTNSKKIISELNEEVENPTSLISYVGEVNEEDLDPLNEIKKQAIADYLARTAAAVDKESDRGTSLQDLQNKFNNTAKLDEGTVGSSITTKA